MIESLQMWIFGQDWCDLWHSFGELPSTSLISCSWSPLLLPFSFSLLSFQQLHFSRLKKMNLSLDNGMLGMLISNSYS